MAQSLTPVYCGVTTVTAATTTATTANIALPLAEDYSIVFDVITAGGTSPLLDIVMQVSFDKGTTYINAPLRSAQFTTTGAAFNTLRCGLGWAEAATTQVAVADTGGAVNKNFVFDPAFVKFKYTIAGTSPSFTFKILVFCNPLGTRSAS